MTDRAADSEVRAMHARYDGWCSAPGCGTSILRGHILYRVKGSTLCYACGRRYVDENRPS